MASPKRLVEQFAFTGRVDRSDPNRPYVRGVLLCGPVSENRRRYLKKAFEGERVKLYNGAPVNLNHGRGPDGRPYETQIGIVENARHRADGMPLGDIAVNPKKPHAEGFLWDAEFQPKACGMSHVAHCETTRAADGFDDVTGLVRVEAVDVISANNAATTKGLFENRGATHVKISLKAFVERFGPKWGPAKWGAARKMCEDMGAPADAPVMDSPPEDAADGDLKGALMAALAPILDEAFESGNPDKAVSALKDFIKMHAKHTGNGDAGRSLDDAAPPTEGKRPSLAGVLKECTDKGFTPDTTQLVAIADIPTAAGRASLIEQLKKASEGQGRETPRSSPRAGTQTTRTAPATEAKLPDDPKAFAARYRE